MWAEFIEKEKPGAKVAQLVFNNDFGKAYQTAFEGVAEEKGFDIVETKLHEGTAANIDNEVAAILAADPDVVIGETTGAFCSRLMAGLAAGGYEGITIISATCASVASFFKPVDPAGDGVYVLGQQKDPSDPRFADDEAVVQYKEDVAEFGAGADANNGRSARATTSARCSSTCSTRAAELEGGLTRANIMNAAWSVDFQIPLVSVARRRWTASTTPTSPSTPRCCSTTRRRVRRSRPATPSTSRASTGVYPGRLTLTRSGAGLLPGAGPFASGLVHG